MNDEREAETAEAAKRLERLADECKILLPEEVEDLRMVLHGLRIYRFERDGANESVERMRSFREQGRRKHEAQMRRIWALVNRKRKTLAMADLLAALDEHGLPPELDATGATTSTTTTGA